MYYYTKVKKAVFRLSDSLAQTQYVFSAFLISRKMCQIIKDFFSPVFLEKGKSETAMIYGYPDLLSYLSPFKPECNQSHY